MTAPAEMPGVEEIAGTIVATIKASKLHVVVSDAGDDGCRLIDGDVDMSAVAKAVLALFAPILAEKEREKDAAVQLAEMNATAGAFWAKRGESAEVRNAAMMALLVRAKDHIVYNADSLSMNSPATLLVEDIAAAIRAQGE